MAQRFKFGPARAGEWKKFGTPSDPSQPGPELRDARVDFVDAVNQDDGINCKLYVEAGVGVIRPARLHVAVAAAQPAEDADPAAWLASQGLTAAVDVSAEANEYGILAPPPRGGRPGDPPIGPGIPRLRLRPTDEPLRHPALARRGAFLPAATTIRSLFSRCP